MFDDDADDTEWNGNCVHEIKGNTRDEATDNTKPLQDVTNPKLRAKTNKLI
jgi:hypothetical protein